MNDMQIHIWETTFQSLMALFITLKSEVYNLSKTFNSQTTPPTHRPLSQLTDHSPNSQTTPPTHGPLPQLTDHSPNSRTTPPTHRPRQLTDHSPNSQTTPTHGPLPQLMGPHLVVVKRVIPWTSRRGQGVHRSTVVVLVAEVLQDLDWTVGDFGCVRRWHVGVSSIGVAWHIVVRALQ